MLCAQKEEDSRPVSADFEEKGVFFASQVGPIRATQHPAVLRIALM